MFGVMTILIVILRSLQVIYSLDILKIHDEVLDYVLIGVGATRLIFLDAPIALIFIA